MKKTSGKKEIELSHTILLTLALHRNFFEAGAAAALVAGVWFLFTFTFPLPSLCLWGLLNLKWEKKINWSLGMQFLQLIYYSNRTSWVGSHQQHGHAGWYYTYTYTYICIYNADGSSTTRTLIFLYPASLIGLIVQVSDIHTLKRSNIYFIHIHALKWRATSKQKFQCLHILNIYIYI